jgi:arsenite methyltransferase
MHGGFMNDRSSGGHMRANYGIDAPGVIRAMALLALGLIGGGLLLRAMSAPASSTARLGTTLIWPGGSFAITALLMLASSRFGKQRARDRLLDGVKLAGTESVLDVGCGHGLMLIGAAKRLSSGHAYGVDLWSQTDQHANSPAATIANAQAEGVLDRVTVKDGDMRSLPFEDASMDVVISSLAIHNVSSATDRARAIREIARVLRPRARVALMDIAHVGDYTSELKAAGFSITRTGVTPWIFPPTREVWAERGVTST